MRIKGGRKRNSREHEKNMSREGVKGRRRLKERRRVARRVRESSVRPV